MIEYDINGFITIRKRYNWELEEIKSQKYYEKIFKSKVEEIV